MTPWRLEIVLNEAVRKANQLRHEYLTLEILLWALLKDPVIRNILTNMGADFEKIHDDLEKFINDSSYFSILGQDEIEELGQRQFVNEDLRKMARESGILYQPEPTLALQRVIQRSAIHVQSSGKKNIESIHLLVSMFHEKNGHAISILETYGVGRFELIQTVAHGLDRPDNAQEAPTFEEQEGAIGNEGHAASKGGPGLGLLEKYADNLNEMAKRGDIDPIVGREMELKRMTQILCRRNKNNPLLVGDAGVGKTALAHGLAWSIVQGSLPEILNNATVYALDMATVVAGTKYRGEFEQRFKGILNELEQKASRGERPVLFIDEIHTVMGAGSTSSGGLDASNILKPALASGKVRCMGSTTHEEYRKFIEKDHAFGRRFQKVDVGEPSEDETLKILQGLKGKFEEHHNVEYPLSVLRLAIGLAEKYLTDRFFPDKAIDIIDEAGAAINLLPSHKRKKKVTTRDIEAVVAYMAKVPMESLEKSEQEKLKRLREQLKLVIFGQDEAIDKVCDSIMLSRSGLADEGRPVGSFLFAGPTGVGKTELSIQLARILDIHFKRFDMSEYMEKHSVSKLIGAPPGYVGHESGGVLTDAVKKNPHCVLLLDEIEKAHEDIFNVLLQVMDHGHLTDSMGRSTDFRNVILIMTSNAGAKEMDGGTIGLSEGSNNEFKRDKVIKNFFTPEFRNRLSGIVYFNKLQKQQIMDIIDKFLWQLEMKLAQKKVELEISAEAKEWIFSHGSDDKMGARPISRIIDQHIKGPASGEILFGHLSKSGGKMRIFVENNGLVVRFSER